MRDDQLGAACGRHRGKLIEPFQPTPDCRCAGREEWSSRLGVLIPLPRGVHAVEGEFQVMAKGHLGPHWSRERRNCLWRTAQTREHVLQGDTLFDSQCTAECT